MIPKGKCRCFCASCNEREPFYADEALYKVFSRGAIVSSRKEVTEEDIRYMESLKSSEVESYYASLDDDADDLSAGTDRAVENIDSGESAYHSESSTSIIDEDVFVSVAQLIESNNIIVRDDGIRIRFIPEKSSAPEMVDGHYIYREVTLGVTVGDEDEREVTYKAHDRYCKYCKKSAGIGISMGYKDYYIFLVLGCTNSGKTTWLDSTYEKRGTDVAGWLLQRDQDNDYSQSYANLQKNKQTKRISATQIQTEQERLIFYHSLSKNVNGNGRGAGVNNRNIGIVFRDVAGELFTFSDSLSNDEVKEEETKREYALQAQRFAAFSDGILVFRDVTSMPMICSMHGNPPEDCELETADYQSRIHALMKKKRLLGKETTGGEGTEKDANVTAEQSEPERKLFTDYDISYALEYLHLPTDHKFSAMYVMNKTDILRTLISNPIFDNNENPIYPFDFRCNVGQPARVLTGDSRIFSSVDHRERFDLENYLRTAVETAHFVSGVDATVYNNFCRIVSNQTYNRGITAITALGTEINAAFDTKRVLEPFAWLVESLINGEDFSGSLIEQYCSHITY